MEENTGWEHIIDDASNLKKDAVVFAINSAGEKLPATEENIANSNSIVTIQHLTPSEVVDRFKDELPEEVLRAIDPNIVHSIINFKPINKYGECPHCKSSWDGGDIFEELCKKEALTIQGDAGKMAAMYGWTEHDKKRFSATSGFSIEGKNYVECFACKHLFEEDTSIEYDSMIDLKLGRPRAFSIKNQDDDDDDDINDSPFF